MKYYLYNINNKMEFISIYQTDDAEEINQIQSGMTTIQPPEAVQGKVWCFNGGIWDTLLDDYRGKLVYDITDSRQFHKGFYVGVIPERFTLIAPPDCKYKYIFNGAQWQIVYDKTIFSKLQIRRACRELGIESKLNDLLNSNEIFASDWSDAQDIDLADSILLQALKEGKFTDEEIDKIKALCHG